jgi:hypothetical protein
MELLHFLSDISGESAERLRQLGKKQGKFGECALRYTEGTGLTVALA